MSDYILELTIATVLSPLIYERNVTFNKSKNATERNPPLETRLVYWTSEPLGEEKGFFQANFQPNLGASSEKQPEKKFETLHGPKRNNRL
jgi:hypothetical protein